MSISTYLCKVDGLIVRVDQRAKHEADHAVQAKNTTDIAALSTRVDNLPANGGGGGGTQPTQPTVTSTLVTYQQTTPASSWSWAHNLNGYPPITLFEDDDPQVPVYTDIHYVDANHVLIEWPEATTGRATAWGITTGSTTTATRATYHQTVAATQWIWQHNQNGYPPLVLFTDDDPQMPVLTDVYYTDPNSVLIEWPEPTTGFVFI